MQKYQLTCCSTADVTEEFYKSRNIAYICFHFTLDGVEYADDLGKTIPFDRFYKMIADGAMPVTSQVGTGEYVEFWEPYLKQGTDIFHVTLSSGISGTINSAMTAKELLEEKYPERKIMVLDSLAASSGYGLFMDYLAEKRDEGLIDSDDLQELEERLRTLSDFVIGGNDNQSGAAIEEIEYDDMANESVSEGKPLSSKYSVAITLYDKSKMNNQSFVPWSFLSLEDDGNRTNDGKPWVRGAFGNCVIKVQKGVNGAKGLYLATKRDINALKKFKSQEDVIDYIEKNCAEVDPKKVNYDKIFDIKIDEEVKPTTSEKQLQHLREIQPLTQTDEAKAKRAKTIKEKKARKLLNVIDEDDISLEDAIKRVDSEIKNNKLSVRKAIARVCNDMGIVIPSEMYNNLVDRFDDK